MTAEALKNLLRRHGREITEDAEAEDDKRGYAPRASGSAGEGASASNSDPKTDTNNNRE